jgi:sugar phosphate isomerase/epimerase
MDNSRRIFIKNSLLATAAAALVPQSIFAQRKRSEKIGVQLYSVRDAMSADPSGTLKKVGVAGFHNVEHAGYDNRKFYGYSVKEFKKILTNCGLLMPSGHSVMTAQHWDKATADFTKDWKYTIEDAAEAGQKYVISPWLDESLRTDIEGLKRFMDQFNKCGELCKASGIKFGYHNHDFEFTTMIGQIKLYDYILQNTEPSLVAQQLDMGNMYGTPGNPLDYIHKYPGRFELIHVKDETKSKTSAAPGEEYESTILAQGLVPVKQILKAARETGGTSMFIIEHESYQGKDPIDCIKIDLQVIKKWGY